MAAIMFDTHAFVKELTQAGMPEAQAEVLARNQAALIDEKLATKEDIKRLELATKEDIKRLELATKKDLEKLETCFKRDMKEMELRLTYNLTVRFGSMMVVSIGVIAALVKLL